MITNKPLSIVLQNMLGTPDDSVDTLLSCVYHYVRHLQLHGDRIQVFSHDNAMTRRIGFRVVRTNTLSNETQEQVFSLTLTQVSQTKAKSKLKSLHLLQTLEGRKQLAEQLQKGIPIS